MPEQSFTDVIREYLESQFSGGGGGGGGGGDITVDTELSSTSTNPVQNRVITAALALKASLTDIPQMATQTNLSDWTQGKTVDAAVLKTLFSAAALEVDNLQVNKADKSELLPLQTKAITDTGGYFTTDTVDGALQEIGAELAGVNTLLGSGVIT